MANRSSTDGAEKSLLQLYEKQRQVKEDNKKLRSKRHILNKQVTKSFKQLAENEKKLQELKSANSDLRKLKSKVEAEKADNKRQKEKYAAKYSMLKQSEEMLISKYLEFNKMKAAATAQKSDSDPSPVKKTNIVVKAPEVSVADSGVQTVPFQGNNMETQTISDNQPVKNPPKKKQYKCRYPYTLPYYRCFYCGYYFDRKARCVRHVEDFHGVTFRFFL